MSPNPKQIISIHNSVKYITALVSFPRQYGLMVRTLALKSRVPGFKTRSDHSLNLFLVVPGSSSRPHF